MHNAAVILVFHGSRHPLAGPEAAAFTARIQALDPHQLIGHGFLRECSPSLEQAIESAVVSGAQTVRVLPVFAVTGSHTTKDIPDIINQMIFKHPGVTFLLDPVLVQTPQFERYVLSRLTEA
ncbi:MAG TPA: CbiX/SirB N-terminal domain-containing protein [Candidatus Ozemobacteraceae bacterium]|nr:CbiX/SirB N-terminal domain-containing protein [Candidatus Ozemobacteraceae bacterium]